MWTLLAVALLILVLFFWPFEPGAAASSAMPATGTGNETTGATSRLVARTFSATLLKKSRFLRVLEVTTAHGVFNVEYNGYGIGYETVRVDGNVAARRGGFGRMSHRFDFAIGPSQATLTVAIPLWGEIFPLCRLRLFSLEVEGVDVYTESEGSLDRKRT